MANNNNNKNKKLSSSTSSAILKDDSEWIVRITRGVEKSTPLDTMEIGPCIHKVPNTLSDLKPEAYFPQKIGLGPYHHFRSDLYYITERKKFDAVTRLLSPANHQVPLNSQHPLILKLTKYDDVVRSFYKECCLDLKAEVLAWVVVLDAFFLLNYLRTSHPDGYGQMKEWALDILMVENQIPLVLLWTIYRSIQPSYEVKLRSDGVEIGQDPHNYSYDFEREFQNALGYERSVEKALGTLLYETLLAFCDENSPFALAKLAPYWWYNRSRHLLDFMYNLIVCDDDPKRQSHKRAGRSLDGTWPDDIDEPISKITEFVLAVLGFTRLQDIQKALTFVSNIPWKVILGVSRKVYKSDDNEGLVAAKRTEIPSASELKEIGGVKFNLTEFRIDGEHRSGCVKGICFNKMDLTVHLPVITLNSGAEVILRNLVAHEELLDKHQRPIRIVDYVHLMHGIIHTTEDVQLLRDADIIYGSLDNGKIMELFDGISKSTGNTGRESYLKEIIDAVNKHFDNRPRVKARRYTKKCVYTSWKLVVFVASVVTILQLILKALCAVYDCNNFFNHKQGVSVISPADVGLDMFPTL